MGMILQHISSVGLMFLTKKKWLEDIFRGNWELQIIFLMTWGLAQKKKTGFPGQRSGI